MLKLKQVEIVGWQRYFQDYPPEPWGTQRLLAEVWAAVVNQWSKQKRHPREVAPWLYGDKPRQLEAHTPTDEESLKARRRAKARQVAQAYDMMLEEQEALHG